MRAKIKKAEPVLDVEFPQLLQDMIGDLTSAPEPVVIKLFAQDPELLHAVGAEVGERDQEDTRRGGRAGRNREHHQRPRHGVQCGSGRSPRAPASPPRRWSWMPAPCCRASRRRRPWWSTTAPTPSACASPTRPARSLESIRNTLLVSGTGKTATIGSLATMIEMPGQTEIRRENLQRDVQVTARFEGMNLGDGMEKVQQAVARAESAARASACSTAGSSRSSRNRSGIWSFVLALAVVLVFMVLLFEFGNFAAPVAVLASALLSTCGVFLALLITGTTFNLSSFMGLIMVIGIVAKNGILLLDADQKFRAEGIAAEEAMIRAGERRLRPIMMTALATVAGMIPLALALGRRLADAAASGHRGDRRHSGLDGAVPGGHSGRSLLHRRPALTKE